MIFIKFYKQLTKRGNNNLFLSKILRFLKGFIRVEISGIKTSEFLNCLIKNNIYTWNISKIKNKIYINIYLKNYRLLYNLSKGYNIKIKIYQKYGLYFYIKKYKKRCGVVVGILLFFIILIIMSQFIWNIEVHGNKTIKTSQIIDFISSQKVRPGKFRKNIDVRTIEREMLLKFKKISWVSINILGSKINIEINERTLPPKKLDIGEPCNIVASKKGIIKNIEAYQGQNLVEIGDFVEKNQILVSGILEDKSLNNTPVYARARAIATVEEVFNFCQPLRFQEKQYKNSSSNLYIQILDKNIPINFTKKIDGETKYLYSTIYPKIFDISLPINIKKRCNYFPTTVSVNLSAQDAKNKLINKIKQKEIEMKNENIKIISKQIIEDKLINNQYLIVIKYLTEEDIAQPQEIIFSNN